MLPEASHNKNSNEACESYFVSRESFQQAEYTIKNCFYPKQLKAVKRLPDQKDDEYKEKL
jgi:hypothetical protein